MKIQAKVLLDSLNPFNGKRIITMELTYPRYIHAEFMTHRMFSRNASSSRAIPIARLIDKVRDNPVFPIEWGSNKPGMQAGEPISRMAQTEAEAEWHRAIIDTLKHAQRLKEIGVHKQIVNRLLEPFSTITVVVTATEWDNFFDLRISPLAQPEIRQLAIKMRDAQNASTPVTREYHAPYMTQDEIDSFIKSDVMMFSAARCARVSYLNHDGLEPDLDKDMALATRLLKDKHASVFEHQAMARTLATDESRNFRGWLQHRALLGL